MDTAMNKQQCEDKIQMMRVKCKGCHAFVRILRGGNAGGCGLSFGEIDSGEGEDGWRGGEIVDLLSTSSVRLGDDDALAEGVREARLVLSFSTIDCNAADAADVAESMSGGGFGDSGFA